MFSEGESAHSRPRRCVDSRWSRHRFRGTSVSMESLRVEELVTIVGLVREGKAATRGDIAEQMSLRSTTVSEMVGELVAHDLLRATTIKKRGRGRPAAQLTFNPLRLGAVFVSVVDRMLIAKAVDLGGRILDEASITPPENAANATMADHVRRLVADIAHSFPQGTDICAVVCSFSGVIDVPRSTWCFHFALAAIAEPGSCRGPGVIRTARDPRAQSRCGTGRDSTSGKSPH